MKKLMLTMVLGITTMFCAVNGMHAGEVLGSWQFKDAANIGKDSSGAGNDLKVNGNPIVEDDGLFLHGGTVNLPKDEQDYLYNTSPEFDLGNESFSVECWFKTSDVVYNKLVGTRETIRPKYSSKKGWALGLSKGKGAIIFVVNDDKNKYSYSKASITESSWDGDVLNYLVGVRDRESKTLKLYLNGELIATEVDETADITNSGLFSIGLDTYAGSLTEGIIRNVKIQNGVLPETEIAKTYAKEIKVKNVANGIVLTDSSTVPVNLKIDNTDGLNGKLNLQPQPQKIKYSHKYTELKQPVYVQLPENSTDQQKVAEKILISDFKSNLKIDLKELEAGKKINVGTVVKLAKSTKKSHSESYRLKIKNGRKVTKITLSSVDHGVIYGALTLMQIIEQSSLIEKGNVSVPKKVSIYDYPEVPRRIQVRLLSMTLTDSDVAIHRVMLRTARTRLNYYNVAPLTPSVENIKRVVDIANMYGIDVVATVGYMHCCRELNKSIKVSEMGPILDKLGEAADAGCKGISFHFDDLGTYASEAAKYPGGVGAFQRAFLVEVQKVATEHGVSFVSMCPTMYMRLWKSSAKTWFGDPKNYTNYFEDVSHLPGGDIELFYTDLLNIDDLKERGVRRPAYYLNGVWGTSQMFSVYAGPTRLTWSWHGFEVDPVKGPTLLPEMMVAWRDIAKNNVETVWVGAGGVDGPMIAGIWMWNPSVFNEKAALKEVNRSKLLGAGTFDELLAYEKNTLPLVALFKTYVNGWTSEFHVQVVEPEHELNADDLIAFWNNYQKAEVAMKTIKVIIAKDNKVYRPREAKKIIKEMQDALDLFKPKLIRKLNREGITVE
jgi:hypothetical protein